MSKNQENLEKIKIHQNISKKWQNYSKMAPKCPNWHLNGNYKKMKILKNENFKSLLDSWNPETNREWIWKFTNIVKVTR